MGDIPRLLRDHDDIKDFVNIVDKQGRTAKDLAALSGQVDIMELLDNLKFMYNSRAWMRFQAKKRASQSSEYLAHVHDEL